jgi:hypothetical protein
MYIVLYNVILISAICIGIMCRYNWHQFGIVTSEIAGHDDFVQTIRKEIIFIINQLWT